MKHQHSKDKPTCTVCGARRNTFANTTTCDAICTRAKAAGRSRGKQIYVELVAAVSKPWADDTRPVNQFAYRTDEQYNQPGLAA